jgi:Na+-transporting methylmalonyl-CoA/oxaloacetate decarboxylase beta subunit
MKNILKPFGIIAVIAIIGFTAASCATASSVGGASGPHGFFTGNGSASTLTAGAQEVASYSVILGIIDSGYADYATAVKAAEAAGKTVTSVTKWMLFSLKTTAYAE